MEIVMVTLVFLMFSVGVVSAAWLGWTFGHRDAELKETIARRLGQVAMYGPIAVSDDDDEYAEGGNFNPPLYSDDEGIAMTGGWSEAAVVEDYGASDMQRGIKPDD
jgi:hypothetical protein